MSHNPWSHRRREAAALRKPPSRRRDEVQVEDLRPRSDAWAARPHPGGDVLGRVRIVDQPQPDGSGAGGTTAGGRLYDDDVGLVAYVQTGGHANRRLLPQARRLRRVIQSGHLGAAAAAVPAHDDPARHQAGRIRCLRVVGRLIDRCPGHAEPALSPGKSAPVLRGGDRVSLLALGSRFVPAFPPAWGSGLSGIRSPITVAGPRRIHTGFLGPPSPCRRPSFHPGAVRPQGPPPRRGCGTRRSTARAVRGVRRGLTGAVSGVEPVRRSAHFRSSCAGHTNAMKVNVLSQR